MLTTCPECKLMVSDKADFCPHCGYVFRKIKKVRKRRRLPNGFGQISEIKGSNLRKPFRAMITVGKDSNGRPVQKLLKPEAYFETYNDAYAALLEYNKNPYSLDRDLTMQGLYGLWSEYYYAKAKSDAIERTYRSTWSYASSIYSYLVVEVRSHHLRSCIETAKISKNGKTIPASPNIKHRLKMLFNMLFDYAVEHELADKNVARDLRLGGDLNQAIEEERVSHKPYTDDEMQKLWDTISMNCFSDIIVIQCYTGFRPQELALIRLENVDLDQNIIRGGMKTAAGKDRIVPIHRKIKELVKCRYDEAKSIGSEYLFNVNVGGEWMNYTYDRLRYRYNTLAKDLGFTGHRMHDGRAHFITMAKKYNMDEYALKRIVGHAITDLTEKVYTQRDIEWLKSEMNKIL